MVEKLRPDELAAFKEAFDTFDKNTDGTISTKVDPQVKLLELTTSNQELHAAMRRGGQNPTESEVQDMINSVSTMCNGKTWDHPNIVAFQDEILV